MSRLDEVVRAAELLAPEDRLRLISTIWDSLPPDDRVALNADQLMDRCRNLENGGAEVAPKSPLNEFMRLIYPGRPATRLSLYAATRRFDLATILVAMAGYSILFTMLTLMNCEPFWKAYFGVLIAVVGIGQAILERFIDPRRASIYVGIAFHTICSLFLWSGLYGLDFIGTFFLVVVLNGLIGGALLGYVSGVLVGGVFLVADALRTHFGHRAEEDCSTAEAPPQTNDDRPSSAQQTVEVPACVVSE